MYVVMDGNTPLCILPLSAKLVQVPLVSSDVQDVKPAMNTPVVVSDVKPVVSKSCTDDKHVISDEEDLDTDEDTVIDETEITSEKQVKKDCKYSYENPRDCVNPWNCLCFACRCVAIHSLTKDENIKKLVIVSDTYDRSDCVKEIKKLIEQCEKSEKMRERFPINIKLYNILCGNIWFLDVYKNFQKTVLNKLDEHIRVNSSNEDSIRFSVEIFAEIFKETITLGLVLRDNLKKFKTNPWNCLCQKCIKKVEILSIEENINLMNKTLGLDTEEIKKYIANPDFQISLDFELSLNQIQKINQCISEYEKQTQKTESNHENPWRCLCISCREKMLELTNEENIKLLVTNTDILTKSRFKKYIGKLFDSVENKMCKYEKLKEVAKLFNIFIGNYELSRKSSEKIHEKLTEFSNDNCPVVRKFAEIYRNLFTISLVIKDSYMKTPKEIPVLDFPDLDMFTKHDTSIFSCNSSVLDSELLVELHTGQSAGKSAPEIIETTETSNPDNPVNKSRNNNFTEMVASFNKFIPNDISTDSINSINSTDSIDSIYYLYSDSNIKTVPDDKSVEVKPDIPVFSGISNIYVADDNTSDDECYDEFYDDDHPN